MCSMFSLPKGAPVVTGLPASKDAVPEFLGRLATTGFTGYARYNFAASLAILLFESGKLVSVMVTRGGARVTGLEALTELCQRVATEDGSVDVYRLEPDLTMALHGLLHGEYLVRGQELKLIDVRALTAQLKAQKLNGCVRVYTGQRSSLIFYKDGAGFGFFHDGSERMETTANESQKIANLPGAKMDVLATRSAEQLQAYDILEMVNLQKVWDNAVRANQARLTQLQAQNAEIERLKLDGKLAGLEETLKVMASEVLGAMGRNLVTKEVTDRGGRGCLARPDQVQGLLGNVEKAARMVAGASKVKDLVERLKAEVARQLAAAGG